MFFWACSVCFFRDCFSRLKLCFDFASASRALRSCTSAFSRMSCIISITSPLCDLYASADGAPASSPSTESWRAWSIEKSCCDSPLVSQDASMTAPRPRSTSSRLSVSTVVCTRAPELFFASFMRISMARPSMSMASMSCFSEALKDSFSSLRSAVIVFNFWSLVASRAESCSILATDASMSLFAIWMSASSFPFCFVALFTSCVFSLAVLLHQSAYLL
mmetsp:Transcript_30884/g.89252  ORF Transcript_30884/g.89252 Transcript_30884/m.89252 type:complete len:219 (+) Transcript_30884:721-1377(+)